MVWNLLRRNISAAQIAGYAVADLIGLAIVITALTFYNDLRSTVDDNDSIVGTDYLIVSKSVPLLSVIGGQATSTSFTAGEIDELQKQPWIKKVGVFEAARFDVGAAIEMGGRRMSTALFFEAIPDEFYDIKPSDWHFDPSDPMIPIVISKDYLALYNFGFAASRGFPQLSEDIISRVPITVSIAGNGRYDRFPAHIVGFSSRLNTIAVPGEFLSWANSVYGQADRPSDDPSRLIIEVDTPGDPVIEKYFDEHDIEVAGDKGNASRALYIMKLITTIVVAVGLVITALAVFILMLSIYLLIQKSREKLHDLMLLGYSPRQICRYYFVLVAAVNTAILVMAIMIAMFSSAMWRPSLEAMDAGGASMFVPVMTGIGLMVIVTALNFITIHRLVRKA